MTRDRGVDRIDNDADGTFAVTTDSGTNYVLDMGGRTLLRLPNGLEDWRKLRRDGQTVDLLEVERCTVGGPAVFIIDLHVPGVPYTTRITTEVVSIRRLADGHG